MGEFDLIARYFKRNPPFTLQPPAQAAPYSGANTAATSPIALGIGDDCALLTPAPGQQLAISTDMLVEGRHFFADVDPEALGHKALAVNLSDLAAMGAEPLAFTLALALPPQRAADNVWMSAFARGLFALADAHHCTLIGGDTTAGPLNICITVFGQVPIGQALRRDGAKPGDDIWVSGTLGEARLALLALQDHIVLPIDQLTAARARLERPIPRLTLGQALRGIATSALDLSDGLAGDLGHILKASRVGAALDAASLPPLCGIRAPALVSHGPLGDLTAHVLTGGDDYELLFTAPFSRRDKVRGAAMASHTPVTRIGRAELEAGLWLLDAAGNRHAASRVRSFDHFS